MRASLRVRELRDEILRIAASHGAGNVHVFGSAARGDYKSSSDIDLLVDIVGATTPWFVSSLTSSNA